MKHNRSSVKTLLFTDSVTAALSLLLACWWTFGHAGIDVFAHQIQYQVFFFAHAVCLAILSSRFRLYESSRTPAFWEEAWGIVKTVSLCMAVASLPAFFIRAFPISRAFLVYLWISENLLLISTRIIIGSALQYIRRHGYDYRNVVIIGRNLRAAEMAQRIRETPELGLRILGYVDSRGGRNGRGGIKELRLLGFLDDLEEILRKHVVDEVLVFLPIKSFYHEIQEIIHTCETVGVEAKIPTDLFTRKIARSTISHYDGIPVIDLYTSPKMSWRLFIKRLLDITVSSALLVLLSPLLLLVGGLIKATSAGPIFFVQDRVGYNGRIFRCRKFRTMVEDAEEKKCELMALNEASGPVFKMKSDPRVTPVGRWLRKASIDELPQLINVLFGEMSLVGPRPPIPNEVARYDLNDLRRLSVKPGITCLWQVDGRNSIPFEKWMELDRRYIDEWSLRLDAKILLKTIPAVLRGTGAS